MERQFSVEPELFAQFPDMRLVVAVVAGLDNQKDNDAVSQFWNEAWSGVDKLGLDDARHHPYVGAWREHFAALGVSMKRFPTSVEALLRRALKGGEPFRINPVVDFYNALTLRHICPAGAFDLDVVGEHIELRRTRRGDQFTAMGAQDTIELPVDEVAYASEQTVLTRHFMWRQSAQALIEAESTQAFLVAEIPGVAGMNVAEEMQRDLLEGLGQFFNCQAQSFLLDADHRQIDWFLPKR